MYFGRNPLWTGGHESAGAPAAATDWYLVEGATGPFFETFLLLANPSSEAADVTITYLTNTAVPLTKTKQIPANGRLTINIGTDDAALTNVAVGAHVTSTKPIIVERSQYWPYSPDQWYEAHNSFGQTAAAMDLGARRGTHRRPRGLSDLHPDREPAPDQQRDLRRAFPTRGVAAGDEAVLDRPVQPLQPAGRQRLGP